MPALRPPMHHFKRATADTGPRPPPVQTLVVKGSPRREARWDGVAGGLVMSKLIVYYENPLN